MIDRGAWFFAHQKITSNGLLISQSLNPHISQLLASNHPYINMAPPQELHFKKELYIYIIPNW